MKTNLLLTLFFALFGWKASAQWTSANNGITNLNAIPLAISGSNIFIGTYGGGVFLSTNNGGSWTAVNNGLTTSNVFSMVANGTSVFAGTFGGSGVYRSLNNGTTWTVQNTGITSNNIYSMAATGSMVFAGTLGGGIFASSDNGNTWTAANTGLTDLNVLTLYVDGGNLYAGTNAGGAFISTDNGGTWSPINTGLSILNVRNFVRTGSNLYLSTGGAGVFLSTNNGSSWSAVNTDLPNLNVWTLTVSGSNLFAGTYGGGVFLTTNNGASWTPVSSSMPASPDVRSLRVIGSLLFAGINGGGGVYVRQLSQLITFVDASFSYAAASYCADEIDPVPSTIATAGGIFSATAGVVINPSTGEIDLIGSTPGTYTITYIVSGFSSTQFLTIYERDDSSFSYSASGFCLNHSDPTPTITGTPGGMFNSTVGLAINSTTGEIDLNTSLYGAYVVIYTTGGACQSSSTFDLTLSMVDNTTTVNGSTILASAAGAIYQWLDCDNAMSEIAGETGNLFNASSNGNYAVEITQNGCTDTSACVAITTVELVENDFTQNFMVFPNPTAGNVTVQFASYQDKLTLKMYSVWGELIHAEYIANSTFIQFEIDEPAGIYILEISDEQENKERIRVVKQ
jgi:hypothetical protein